MEHLVDSAKAIAAFIVVMILWYAVTSYYIRGLRE